MQSPITYADYMKSLDDADQARSFLKRVLSTGYTIDKIDPKSIDILNDKQVVELSKEVWPIYYLETANFVGHWVQ